MSQAEDTRAADAVVIANPREDLFFTGVAAAVLVVFLYFNALNVADEYARAGKAVALWEPMVWEGSSGLFFLGISPFVTALTRRFWPARGPWGRKIAVHALAAVAVSLAHVLTIGAARWGVYRVVGGYYDPLGPLGDWPYEFRKDVLVYATIVGVYVVWRTLRARAQPTGAAAAEVLEVRDGARRHFVALAEVVWVEAAGNYVELHRGGAGLLHRASLSEMHRRLQADGFVRIHRSRLVRREAVAAVESKPTGDFLVRLRDGRELAGSRRYRRPLLAD
ncbi:LytTR family DNA-binding domain-containing protein [Phenylobacterium sp.]|uniref:LytTR family DNA-binding domain-containing protein n=1 Tax=Phenylobacterium sp. TaxID=1871053 RepID=UPI0035626C46